MRVGYLGPEGTVSQAALAAFGAGRGLPIGGAADGAVPMPTLRDTVLAVQQGRLDLAFVPVENSREGPVNPVWDTIALEAPDVRLLAEHVHPVTYCLTVGGAEAEADGDALAAIRTVHSHPQATAQCARWLAEHLHGAAVVAAASTAEAVRAVAAGGDPTVAAIGLRFAAEHYGARIVADGLEDEPDNATRFALIGSVAHRGAAPDDGPGRLDRRAEDDGPNRLDRRAEDDGLDEPGGRTVLVFWGERDDSAGWLVGCLQPFAAREINLTRIVSRPLRRRMGHYMFFLECDGLATAPDVAAALAELRDRAETVRVLGSYPLGG